MCWLGLRKSGGSSATHVDARRVDADLLVRLAQGGLHGRLARLQRAAGEGDLGGVRAEVVGALGEDDVLAAVSGRGEQHEDGRLPSALLGRLEPGEVLGVGVLQGALQPGHPLRARCGHAVSAGPADGASSNFSSLAALSGSVSPMP